MIEDILAEIEHNGWFVNNLFQINIAQWQANLRRPDGDGAWYTGFAIGSTALEALDRCLSLLTDAEWSEDAKPPAGVAAPPEPSLAHKLGLIKPLKRRI